MRKEWCTELLLLELLAPVMTSAAALVAFSNGYTAVTGSQRATKAIQGDQQVILEDHEHYLSHPTHVGIKP